ncbi:MAG: hypothetical protein FWD77_01515 [Betaproteobacteria bacterium]|nr:hypothetical protein [Betaproteobacteria bacterium]
MKKDLDQSTENDLDQRRRFEIEILKANGDILRSENGFDLARIVIKSAFAVLAVWIFMDGLKEISQNAPGQISAVAELAKSIHLSEIVAYIVAATSFGAWRYERSGKKRAIAMLGDFRRKIEGTDPNRSSSCLTETGDTPKE